MGDHDPDCGSFLALAVTGPRRPEDHSGCWPLSKALELAPEFKKILAYCEDPCGAEGRFSGRGRLTKEPMQIVDGCIDLPKKGGLGIEIDRDQIMKANKLYVENCLGARDDAKGMQYLIPGWTFDNKKPCMVR